MKSFSICNIKGFKEETKVDIKPITIFVGKNSCGKSSLIRFPVVVAQSMMSDADAPLMFFGKKIDYGNYEDVVFGHAKRGKMYFSVSYDCVVENFYYRVPKRSKWTKYFSENIEVKIKVGLARYSKRMIVDSCELEFDGKKGIEISRIQREIYLLKFFDFRDGKFQLEVKSKNFLFFRFIPWFSVEGMFEQIIDAYKNQHEDFKVSKNEIKELKKEILESNFSLFDESENIDEGLDYNVKNIKEICRIISYYRMVMTSLNIRLSNDAGEIYYIGPFREGPNRVYRDVDYSVDSVGTRGEDVSVMLKSDYLHGKRIISAVSSWFLKSMNYSLDLKDIGSGLYNVVVQKNDGIQDNLIDVGYGISQVLPIVTQLEKMKLGINYRGYRSSREGSLFIIEQPELHLHPGAQAELGNLFVDAVSKKNNENKINILIETHSEHLIRRLQSLVADKDVDVTNEDVKIYYVDKNDNNEAFVKEMKLLPNGQFEDEWPTGFFDKAYELSMELLRNNM